MYFVFAGLTAVLLAFSDLMLDVLLGFLALYFVDVVGATPAQAGGTRELRQKHFGLQ